MKQTFHGIGQRRDGAAGKCDDTHGMRRVNAGALAALLLTAWLGGGRHGLQAQPLGTAFAFQGTLKDGGVAANGIYDLRFALFNEAMGGKHYGTLDIQDVPVTAGAFTVLLDFGAEFDGLTRRWLEMGVRPGASVETAGYVTLSPRQDLTPVPHALVAAGVAMGSINSLSIANGAVVRSLNGQRDDIVLQGDGSVGVSVKEGLIELSSSPGWESITGIPPGFADGIDHEGIYFAGPGLSLADRTFAVTFDGTGASTTAARSDHHHFGVLWEGSAASDAGLTIRNQSGVAFSRGLEAGLPALNGGAQASGILGFNRSTNNYGDGVVGEHDGGGTGVRGRSARGTGVVGDAWEAGDGVRGTSEIGTGVRGQSWAGAGAIGASIHGPGLYGRTDTAPGVIAISTNGPGLHVRSTAGLGIDAASVTQPAILATVTRNVDLGFTGTNHAAGVFIGQNGLAGVIARSHTAWSPDETPTGLKAYGVMGIHAEGTVALYAKGTIQSSEPTYVTQIASRWGLLQEGPGNFLGHPKPGVIRVPALPGAPVNTLRGDIAIPTRIHGTASRIVGIVLRGLGGSDYGACIAAVRILVDGEVLINRQSLFPNADNTVPHEYRGKAFPSAISPNTIELEVIDETLNPGHSIIMEIDIKNANNLATSQSIDLYSIGLILRHGN